MAISLNKVNSEVARAHARIDALSTGGNHTVKEFRVNSNGTWFVLYNDNYIQQGGKGLVNSNRTITFHKPLKSKPVFIDLTYGDPSTSGAQSIGIDMNSVTNTKMSISTYGTSGRNCDYWWQVDGWI